MFTGLRKTILMIIGLISIAPSAFANVGARVSLTTSTNVRSAPAGALQCAQLSAAAGTVVAGPQTASLGGTSYVWWQINYDVGCDGWSIQDTMQFLQPSTPLPMSPGNSIAPGNIEPATSVTLVWQPVIGAVYYDFGVRDLNANVLVVDTQTGGTSFPTLLSPGTPYRWNVRACVSPSLCSPYTNWLFFRTPSPPPTITTVLPSTFPSSPAARSLTVAGSGFVCSPLPTVNARKPDLSLLALSVSACATNQLVASGVFEAIGAWGISVANANSAATNPYAIAVQASVAVGPTLTYSPAAGTTITLSNNTAAIRIDPNGGSTGLSTTFGSCLITGSSASAFSTNFSQLTLSAGSGRQTATLGCTPSAATLTAGLTCQEIRNGVRVTPDPTWSLTCPSNAGTGLPDLKPIVHSVSASTVPAGSSLQVSFSIQNLGTGAAPATPTGLRFVASTSNPAVCGDSGNTIAPNYPTATVPGNTTAGPFTTTVTLPAAAGPGYVCVLADNSDPGVPQSNTNNDAAYSQLVTITSTTAPGPPLSPIQLTPGDTTEPGPSINRDVLFSWTPSPSATYYRLAVRELVSQTLVEDLPVNGTSIPRTLSQNTPFRWNVAACNAIGCSPFSTRHFFSTQAPAPIVAPEQPASPTPGTTSAPGPLELSTLIVFAWQGDPRTQHFEVLTTSDGITKRYSTDQQSLRLEVEGNRSYSWQVRACIGELCSEYTQQRWFSSPAPISVRPAPPSQPFPGSTALPATVITNNTPTLTWQPSTLASDYAIEVVDAANGDSIFNGRIPALMKSFALSYAKDYRWSVSACNAAGCSAPLTRYFRTPALGGQPSAIRPIGALAHAGGATRNIEFEWTSLQGISAYKVIVADLGIYSNSGPPRSVLTNSNTTSIELPTSHTYSWSVMPCQSATNDFVGNCDEQHVSQATQFELLASLPTPTVPRIYPLLAPNGAQRNLVLVSHGWNSTASNWPNALVDAICSTLGAVPISLTVQTGSAYPARRCDSVHWTVVSLDWWTYAGITSLQSGILPQAAATNGRFIGRQIGLALPVNYNYVHLIGHSAGSYLIEEIAKAYRERRAALLAPAPIIHSTFLDAYCKDFFSCSHGDYSDWAEQYVDSREFDFAGMFNNLTNRTLHRAVNFDVTDLDLFPPLLCWLNSRRSWCFVTHFHLFPHILYRRSAGEVIIDPDIIELPLFLYHVGAELAAWRFPNADGTSFDSRAALLNGAASRFPNRNVRCSLGADATDVSCTSPQQAVTAAPSAHNIIASTSSCGGSGVVGKNFSTANCAVGKGTSTATVDSQITLHQAASQFAFDFEFSGTGGTLRVLIDGEPEYIATQEHAGLHHSTPIDISYLAPGTHELTIEAGTLEGTASNVLVSNLQLSRTVQRFSAEVFSSGFENPQPLMLADAIPLATQVLTDASSADQVVSVTVLNQGERPSATASVSLRWTTTNVGSVCIGSVTTGAPVEALATGGTAEVVLHARLPVTPGTYYGCIDVDDSDDTEQSDYVNDRVYVGPFVVSSENFSVTGTVQGLEAGQSVTLQLLTGPEGTPRDAVSASVGEFAFPSTISTGETFRVGVSQQPVRTTCQSTAGIRVAGVDPSTALVVSCTANAGRWNPLVIPASLQNTMSSPRAILIEGEIIYAAWGQNASGPRGIAMWNGVSWSPLGSGQNNGVNGMVWAIARFNGDLVVAGDFTEAGGVPVNYIAKWNGIAWSPLGSGVNGRVYALHVFGDNLFAGGIFSAAGGLQVGKVARWDGAAWFPVGGPGQNGVDGPVSAFASDGTDLFIGGSFVQSGISHVPRVARWNGSELRQLEVPGAPYLNGGVVALTMFNGDLFAAGNLQRSDGGVAINGIARWDGRDWQSVGGGVWHNAGGELTIRSLASTGGYLFAGGSFTHAGGVLVNSIGRWDGLEWSSLGVGRTNGVLGDIYDIASYRNGVAVAGSFTFDSGISAGRIAFWDPENPGLPTSTRLRYLSPSPTTSTTPTTAFFEVTGTNNPTGQVVIGIKGGSGSNFVCVAPVSSGKCTFTSLPIGVWELAAFYLGDEANQASNSGGYTGFTVN